MAESNEWLQNALFITHNNVRIFRTYRHDSHEDVREYYFGTAADTRDEGDECNFDVRDLPGFGVRKNGEEIDMGVELSPYAADNLPYLEHVAEVIRKAIESGHLQEYIEASKDRWGGIDDKEFIDDGVAQRIKENAARKIIGKLDDSIKAINSIITNNRDLNTLECDQLGDVVMVLSMLKNQNAVPLSVVPPVDVAFTAEEGLNAFDKFQEKVMNRMMELYKSYISGYKFTRMELYGVAVEYKDGSMSFLLDALDIRGEQLVAGRKRILAGSSYRAADMLIKDLPIRVQLELLEAVERNIAESQRAENYLHRRDTLDAD